METRLVISTREVLDGFAQLLEYPSEEFPIAGAGLARGLAELCSPGAAESLQLFATEVLHSSGEELEDSHTSTFSLMPVCVPYIGVQLFGENNFKRGDLIAGLATELAAHSINVAPELPDHLGAVLRLAARATDELQNELLQHCLRPAVQKMAQQIESSSSPYRHLIGAIHQTLTPSWEACCHA